MNYSVGNVVYKPSVVYKDKYFLARCSAYKIVAKSITEYIEGNIDIHYELEKQYCEYPLKFKVHHDKLDKFFFRDSIQAFNYASSLAKLGMCTT